jgi:hypothetical protein
MARVRVMIGPHTAPTSVLSVGTRDEEGRIDIFGPRPHTMLLVDTIVCHLERTIQSRAVRP